MIGLTVHAEERFSERLNIKSLAKKEHQVLLAWERGMSKEDEECPKKIKGYLEHMESNKANTKVKIYNGATYIFTEKGSLITVWALDKERAKICEAVNRKINKRSE